MFSDGIQLGKYLEKGSRNTTNSEFLDKLVRKLYRSALYAYYYRIYHKMSILYLNSFHYSWHLEISNIKYEIATIMLLGNEVNGKFNQSAPS